MEGERYERCVTTVVVAGSVVLVPIGRVPDYRAPEPGECATTVADSLVLATSGEDIRASLVLERWSARPPVVQYPDLPNSARCGLAGEADSSVELDWQLSGPDPLISHVVDYGAFSLPCHVGLTAGRWRVLVSCWDQDAAERFSDEVLDVDSSLGDFGGEAGEVSNEALFPLGPEVWLVQFWPAT